MKLYVWEEVFQNYTYGLAFAVAENKEEAIKAILDGETPEPNYKDDPYYAELSTKEPEIIELDKIDRPIGYWVSGGG
jgi:hypothetical protein